MNPLSSDSLAPEALLERMNTAEGTSTTQLFPDLPVAPLPPELESYLRITSPLPPITPEQLQQIHSNLRIEDYQSAFPLPYVYVGIPCELVQRFFRSDPRTYYSIVAWDRRKSRSGLLQLPSDSSSREPHIREPAEPMKWVDEYTVFALRQHVHDVTGRVMRDHRPIDLAVEGLQTNNLTFDYYLRLRRTMNVRMPRSVFENLAATFVEVRDLSSPPYDPDLLSKLRYQVSSDGFVVPDVPCPPPPGLTYPDHPLEDFSQFCSSPQSVRGYLVAVHRLHRVHADFVFRFINEAFEQFGTNSIAKDDCDFDFGDDPPQASPTSSSSSATSPTSTR